MNAHNHQPERIQQAVDNLRRALEYLESALVEFEEESFGQSSMRPQERKGLDLLSIPEVCQELGMGKSWVYRKLRAGEIPSVKLGRVIKVKRSALEEYLENQAVRQAHDTLGRVINEAQGTVGQAVEGLAGTLQEEPSATQAARRKAQALGVNLRQVQGSGVGGRVTLKDVVAAAD